MSDGEAPDRAGARRSLIRRRQRAAADLDATNAQLLDTRRLRAGGFDDDEHDPDGSPLSSELIRLGSLRHVAAERLADIDAALRDIDAGRYGICVRCGNPIPPGRLEIRPTATRCVACVR